MNTPFFDAVKARRSIYGISKDFVLSDEIIQDIVEEAVKHSPSPFNSQSARVVLLLGAQHDCFWQITKEELRKLVPADKFGPTEEKIAAFASGYGSVLFFEDMTVVESLQKRFPLYQDRFPVWSQHASAILQYVVWTALEQAGFGASLQHYNPIVDAPTKQTWNIPDRWQLVAQMPFGKPTAPPANKEFLPLADRVRVYK